jgi:hypothetical protein
VAGRWRKLLWGIALVAVFVGVSQDCRAWVDSHGYQLVHNDWWAKTRGCVARTPGGDEVLHSEDLRSKAIGWEWQFAIFAVGMLPAVGMIAFVSGHPGGRDAAGG